MSRSFACTGLDANITMSTNNISANLITNLSNIIAPALYRFRFVHHLVDNLYIQNRSVAY